jgi:hypothetical protein
LTTKVESSTTPPSTLVGAGTIARPCIAAPSFLMPKVTLPGFTVGALALIHMSPKVTFTSAAATAGWLPMSLETCVT